MNLVKIVFQILTVKIIATFHYCKLDEKNDLWTSEKNKK